MTGPRMVCVDCGQPGPLFHGSFIRNGLVTGTVGMPKYDWRCRSCMEKGKQKLPEPEQVDDAPF